jgi:hypothetical protein
MEVVIMLNRCLGGGLYPSNVDPNIHKTFRRVCFAKNNTLYGIYTGDLSMALDWTMDVFEGKLEIKELVDTDAVSLLTHTTKDDKTYIMRKNERRDLKDLSIHNVDKKLSDRVKHFLIDNYGTKYGKLSDLMNYAMELYCKVEKGFVKLVKTNNKPFKSFIDENKGETGSYDMDSLFEFFEEIKTHWGNLDEVIESKVKSFVQSTFNISSKGMGKVRKVVNGTVKSFKHENKREKAERLLNLLMRYKEFGFTNKDYAKLLVILEGQGDPRTTSSDLKVLESRNLIKKMRNSAHGIVNYQFVNNDQYHKYNSDLACERFLEGFKVAFQDVDALNVDDLNEFIIREDGLYDGQSRNKRLNWLIRDGLVKRHKVNPQVLFIQK